MMEKAHPSSSEMFAGTRGFVFGLLFAALLWIAVGLIAAGLIEIVTR